MRLRFCSSSILLLLAISIQSCFGSVGPIGHNDAIENVITGELDAQSSSGERNCNHIKHSKHFSHPQSKSYIEVSASATSTTNGKSGNRQKRAPTHNIEWRFISKSELPPKIGKIVDKIEQDWRAHVESQRAKNEKSKPMVVVIQSQKEVSKSMSPNT